jgi:hypothetical protein
LSLQDSRNTETAFRISEPIGGMECSGGIQVTIRGALRFCLY